MPASYHAVTRQDKDETESDCPEERRDKTRTQEARRAAQNRREQQRVKYGYSR